MLSAFHILIITKNSFALADKIKNEMEEIFDNLLKSGCICSRSNRRFPFIQKI